MNIQGYSFCEPEALPKKKKTGVAKTFALVGLAVLGCTTGFAEEVNKNKDHDYVIEFTHSLDILDCTSSKAEDNLHTERDIILSELNKLFSELSSFGWDGYGAHPIEKAAYLNAVSIVKNTPENILKLWNVFPAPNGTISFELKAREVAAMSIGTDGFSFAAMKDDEDPIMDEMEFDALKASEALVRMSKLFEN